MSNKKFDALAREAEVFVREFQHALQRTLVANKPIENVISTWDKKRKKLVKKLNAADKEWRAQYKDLRPQQKETFFQHVRDHMNKEFDRLAKQAKRAAHGRARVVKDGLKGEYNELVSKGVSGLANVDVDRQARRAIQSNVEKLVREHLPDDVPANVHREIGREIAKQITTVEFMEDQFYAIESYLIALSGWMRERLTVTREIGSIKENLEGSTIQDGEVKNVDQQLTGRAKKAAKLDKELPSRLQKSQTRVKAHFKLQPKLALKPAVHFVKRVDARFGLEIRSDKAVIKFKNRLSITTPLTNDRKLHLQTGVEARVGKNLMLELGYGASAGFNNMGNLGQGRATGNLRYNINENASVTGRVEHNFRNDQTKAYVGIQIRF